MGGGYADTNAQGDTQYILMHPPDRGARRARGRRPRSRLRGLHRERAGGRRPPVRAPLGEGPEAHVLGTQGRRAPRPLLGGGEGMGLKPPPTGHRARWGLRP